MQINRLNLPVRATQRPLFFKVLPVSADIVDLLPLDFAQCKQNILKEYTVPGVTVSSPEIDRIENCYTWEDLSHCSGYVIPSLRSIDQDNNVNTYYLGVEVYNDHYVVTGSDRRGEILGNEPDIKLFVGDTIKFNVEAAGHPFYLKTSAGAGTDNQLANVVGQGAQLNIVEWTATVPGTYYYQCSNHGYMVGTITVTEYTDAISPLGNYIGPGNTGDY